ncbi:hypothetical protein EC9_19850 [Rosistilla ulvae]|uniref:Uncharacterized protein n=1 Tax=Rosistilla ulvae TaxID=1930277 RepID=A0A517LYV4_9BACT|nr:hypothetical protein EC9_19850 [Rosistilla ulvae]
MRCLDDYVLTESFYAVLLLTLLKEPLYQSSRKIPLVALASQDAIRIRGNVAFSGLLLAVHRVERDENISTRSLLWRRSTSILSKRGCSSWLVEAECLSEKAE